MMLRCPSCLATLNHPVILLEGDGLVVSCSACGHNWLEASAADVQPTTLPQTVLNPVNAPDREIVRLLSVSRRAQETFLNRQRRRRAMAAAWLGLGLAAVSPAAVALTMPEQVVTAAPAAIRLYDWLGHKVNIYGVEIRNVELQHLLVEGERVIAIKGELINVSTTIKKIPWLRFGLKSGDNQEIYQWQIDSEARPLRPGEARSFVTRVASPPDSAASVEIRFAHAEEIGSNTIP